MELVAPDAIGGPMQGAVGEVLGGSTFTAPLSTGGEMEPITATALAVEAIAKAIEAEIKLDQFLAGKSDIYLAQLVT